MSEEPEVYDFDRWYGAFPKKKDKGAARKAYKAATRIVDADRLQTATEAFADVWDKVTQYRSKHGDARTAALEWCKYPATWLNKESWDDEEIQEYLSKPKQGNIIIKEGEPGWSEWLKHDPTLKTFGGKIVVPTPMPPQGDEQ